MATQRSTPALASTFQSTPVLPAKRIAYGLQDAGHGLAQRARLGEHPGGLAEGSEAPLRPGSTPFGRARFARDGHGFFLS